MPVRIFTFRFRVLDRDKHTPINIEISESQLLDYPGELTAHLVSRVLCNSMCHEVAEVLRLNGKRVRELHT
jgi:hypothetical protein